MKKKSSGQPVGCAIYARSASVEQSYEDKSVLRQVRKCKRFAKKNGWIIKNGCIFTDSAVSGLVVNSGLKLLMRIAAANLKPFDVLICTSIDRIARDTGLAIRIHKTLKQCGVEIHFAELDDKPL